MKETVTKNIKVLDYHHVGLTIRKISKEGNRIKHLSEKNLRKQMLTLLKKIWKIDMDSYCVYSIESSKHALGDHIHMILSLTDTKHLEDVKKRLLKYVDAEIWSNDEKIWDSIDKCEGRFGSIHKHSIWDMPNFISYMSKTSNCIHLYNMSRIR
jgi:hypothetical protein